MTMSLDLTAGWWGYIGSQRHHSLKPHCSLQLTQDVTLLSYIHTPTVWLILLALSLS